MRTRPFSIWAFLVASITAVAAGSWSLLYQSPVALVRENAPVQTISSKPAPTEFVRAKATVFKIVKSYPHDQNAFTQGLLWHEGALYEGTGREGHSEVRKVDLQSGRVLRQSRLPSEVFGEGLVLSDNRLIQITWQSQRAFVFDLKTFQLQGEWKYEGEGWGLTTDDDELIMSDGSSQLSFRDPKTFAEKRRVDVTFNGQPLDKLNELEWINGQVWANVWQTDFIVRINPQTGEVEAYLDCSGLLKSNARTGGEDVLNGIAYDAQTKRIFLTGKLWPKLFEIKLEN